MGKNKKIPKTDRKSHFSQRSLYTKVSYHLWCNTYTYVYISDLLNQSPKNNSDIENNPIHDLVFPEGKFLVQPSTFSKDIMAQLEEAFSLFDKDGDGTICIDEIEIVMKVRVWQASPVMIWSEPELRVPDLSNSIEGLWGKSYTRRNRRAIENYWFRWRWHCWLSRISQLSKPRKEVFKLMLSRGRSLNDALIPHY